ncbi:HNH endonuclease signature motif containing protein [Sinomonas mesophila]|uniref:HNH endonuclease signature motif containing protein n=1 Tax=Sinomonas mesophila TaxID=1531955 RepID=UPI001115AA73|nr:HNH endonuclease signature motif containing protein [Sinomonas mesophila]
MAGEQGFDEGAAIGAPLPGPSPVPDWDPDLDVNEPEDWDDLSPEDLGIVDPMSPEEFAAICSGKVRWIEAPRFDPALFDPLPGTKDVCRCACGHAHQPPPVGQEPPAAEPSAADGEAPAEAEGCALIDDAGAVRDPSDPAGPPTPEAAMAQIRLERAAEVLDALEANEADQARLDANRIFLLAALTRAEGSSSEVPVDRLDAPAVAASEAAAVLKLAQRTTRAMVEEALALTHPSLAPVLAAMRAGRLTRRRAAVILDAAIPTPAARLEEFATAAAGIAAPDDPDLIPTPGALGRRLHRLAEDYADTPLAVRKAKALADRRVDITPCGDGMCHLTALIPLETGALIDTRLTAVARSLQAPDEARTVNQLRADALTDLLLATGTSSAGGPIAGVRTELVVTVPAATLAGTSDTPGEILGYGLIDSEAARRLAAQTKFWTRLVVHPLTGAPLAIERTRYAPTAAMRRFLTIRDATCTFPACEKPGPACEADHTHAWSQGGETDVGNLALLCREHHRQKTLGYWKVRQIGGRQGIEPETGQDSSDSPGTPPPKTPDSPPPGTLEWTGPSGRRHKTYPHSDPPPPF